MNKAVQQYINKVYNRYDINQQSSDDLRVLKATARLAVKREPMPGTWADKQKFVYTTTLPDDYMHLLNCIIEFRVDSDFKCYRAGDHVDFSARRLTADMAAGILHNVYMKPDYKRPYFYINNVNLDNYDGATDVPTSADTSVNTDAERKDSVKSKDTRLSNTSKVRLEIRFGEDDSVFVPECVYIDYIKSPMFIRLTYDEVISTLDKTRSLEFPDYVCFEIVNEFVKLLMENASDPRLQTNYAVNQTVADPTAPPPQSQSSRDRS